MSIHRITNESSLGRSMLKNMLLKPVGYILNFAYTPLLLNYLGDEKYGLWSTILSIISWVNFCDIGIGNGLRNLLTKEIGTKNYEEAQKSISTAYIVLSVISFTVIIILIVFSLFFNWADTLNINYDISWVMIISFTSIAVNFVLGIGKTILYSLQLSERIPILNLLASVIQLIGIVVLKRYSEGNLVYVAIVFGLSSSIVYLENDIQLARKYNYCRFKIRSFDKNKVKSLANAGVLFLILQLGGIAMTSTDNILVTKLFGAVEVTPYSAATRLFAAIEAVFIALIAPIWSRTSIAMLNKDFSWITAITKKLLLIALLFGGGMLLVCVFYEPIAEIWLHKKLYYEKGLILCTFLASFFEMTNATFSSLLNGMNTIKPQAVVAMIQVGLNIPLSVFLANACGMKSVGIKVATMLLFLFSSLVYGFLLSKTIKEGEKAKQ